MLAEQCPINLQFGISEKHVILRVYAEYLEVNAYESNEMCVSN